MSSRFWITSGVSSVRFSSWARFRARSKPTSSGRSKKRIASSPRPIPPSIASSAAACAVLRGKPSSTAQAAALDAMLGGIGRGLDAILFFDLPDEVGFERALKRAKLEKRTDDTPEVIQKRLDIYHRETEPIVEHYRATGKLVPLHAGRTIEEVWKEIESSLGLLGVGAA